MLEALLGTTERVVQEIDSVEYGLTDIQEYYANTGAVCCLQHELIMMAWLAPTAHAIYVLLAGALKKAAENARKDGKSVGCSIVETFGKSATPQELSDVLRLEYRSKLLNPKWARVSKSAVLQLWHIILASLKKLG